MSWIEENWPRLVVAIVILGVVIVAIVDAVKGCHWLADHETAAKIIAGLLLVAWLLAFPTRLRAQREGHFWGRWSTSWPAMCVYFVLACSLWQGFLDSMPKSPEERRREEQAAHPDDKLDQMLFDLDPANKK